MARKKKGKGKSHGQKTTEDSSGKTAEKSEATQQPSTSSQKTQKPSSTATSAAKSTRTEEREIHRPPAAEGKTPCGTSDVPEMSPYSAASSRHAVTLPSAPGQKLTATVRPHPPGSQPVAQIAAAGAQTLSENVVSTSTSAPGQELTAIARPQTAAASSLEPVARKSRREMAKRPGYGKDGKPIALFANYFLLEFKNINIYHYDVDIIFLRQRRKDETAAKAIGTAAKAIGTAAKAIGTAAAMTAKGKSVLKEGRTAREDAERYVSHVEHQMKRAPGKKRCRQVIAQMIQSKSLRAYNPVYDGQKNIYTTKPLPFTEKTTVVITLDEEDRYTDFEVVIQPALKIGGGNVISIEPLRQLYEGRSIEVPQEVIMAFDTVMCHRDPPLTQVQVGRSFFLLNQRPDDLGKGLEIWYGYNQSVHLTERGPAVIVNFAAKAFHKSGSVIEYASEVLGCDILRLKKFERRDIKSLTDSFSKLKVQVTHLHYPRKYAVTGVTDKPARDLRLNVDGTETTVAKYFQQKYRPLRYPYLPCLHMRVTNLTTFIPFEVCEIVPNQPKLGKLTPATTSKMIRKTAILPVDRFRKIEAETRQIQKTSGEIMKKYDLLMDLRFMQLHGRVLASPALAYNGESTSSVVKPVDGKWRIDERQKFFKSGESNSWVIISFTPQIENEFDEFARTLVRHARNLGMGLENVKEIKIFPGTVSTRQALQYVKDRNVRFGVIVLSQRDGKHNYDELKFIADIELNVITQCMDQAVVEKNFNPDANENFKSQVVTNVLLKLNSKLGGVNHKLLQRPLILSRPAIIIGADVIHSARGHPCPSIAAVVGSLDAFPSRYSVTCRTQTNPDEKKSQEIILELKGMVKYVLGKFEANTNGKYPEKIIFFRDGVSEGQFQIVLEKEIPMVQQACNEALGGKIPPLTFIVVQKRHQTRFRPQNPRDGVGKMSNVPPGTTVDTDVTHPVFFDFFLCSHEGIQGTSRPAHYTVLFDENNFGADELQKLCHHLCHTYVKCNRSISIPAPVMYADLACTRAKKYADFALGDDAQSTSSGSSVERKLPPDVEEAINFKMGNVNPGMFFV